MNHPWCPRKLWLVLGGAVAALGCSVGEGNGWVRSERLYIEDCWNGPFDLQPTFFGANPYRDELMIRIQRGNNIQELSDGVTILVTEVGTLRAELGAPVSVGLPPGVSPPGVPIAYDPEPPLVSLAVYLHATCHRENGTVYSIAPEQVAGGDGRASTITFASLFSGDPNERDADDRLTEGRFDAWFADPRDLDAGGSVPLAKASYVSGVFRFFFQRGQPAQPFP